jgi:DNA-binding NtrC family response regulator
MSRTSDTEQRLLIVEDDAGLRELLTEELGDRGYAVENVGSCAEAFEILQATDFDLVVSDLRLPDGSGQDVLRAVRDKSAAPAIILITAFGSVPQAVEALKAGADDFLTKPLDLEHLAVRVERVLAHRRTNVTLQTLRETLRESGVEGRFHDMVGTSPLMRDLFDVIRRVAQVDEPVLITGESGSGKELVARAIHAEGPRAAKPFVAINCASVPESLLEAEFFGHTANAFTGARSARQGLFAEADKGTLFLDEIGEMPAALQAKLLRVLQDGRIRPLGGGEEIAVDVRIIAATNRDIEAEAKAGNWREDLYYRLETLSLQVPPLRERGEDKLELARHFLAVLAAERELPKLRLSEQALDAIQQYDFPGNVRELRNVLTRAATFTESDTIDVQHLPERMRSVSRIAIEHPDPLGITELPTLDELEKRYIRWMLERNDNNKKRTAEQLGVGRRTIYRKLGEE